MQKPKTKKEMIEYLLTHFRYDTMNSWNRAISYAQNVKLHNIGIPSELMDRAYEMLQLDEAYYDINELIREFEEKYDYEWQAGFNGHSEGYIVLYKGGKKESGYKTRCNQCGELTYYEEEQSCHVEGCDGILKKLSKVHYQTFTMPGKGIDMEEDFKEWDMEELRERVDIVWDFDKLCEDCVQAFINFVKDYTVVEKEIMVPKIMKTAIPVA